MRRPLLALAGVAASTGPALAHGGRPAGGTHGTAAALPLALMLGGGAVLATSLYLERAGSLEGRTATAGLLVGGAGFVAGVALAVLRGL